MDKQNVFKWKYYQHEKNSIIYKMIPNHKGGLPGIQEILLAPLGVFYNF